MIRLLLGRFAQMLFVMAGISVITFAIFFARFGRHAQMVGET